MVALFDMIWHEDVIRDLQFHCMSQVSGTACAWSSLWRCLDLLMRSRQTAKTLKQIANMHGVNQVGYLPFLSASQNQALPMYHSLCSASFSPLHICTNFQAYSRSPTCAQIQPDGFLEPRPPFPGQHWLSSTAWATQTLCRLRQKFPSCIQSPDVTCWNVLSLHRPGIKF